ncbi:TRAP transporter substrate-binding protein [Geminicoccus roseus]|uniref:TRAP transporter substrate-binding protein n=1 Tax=Geminicoccus roseus TaxID=404900 RepID=UPI0004223002|nr:TRAP transporter substrate-binding protein [Geminicoccus roseus]
MRLLGLMAGAAVMIAQLGTAHAQEVKEIRLGSPWPTSSTIHQALPVFADEVEKLSEGRLKVLVYPDSQLGDIQALINGVQLGTVDMTYLAIGNAGVLRGGAPLNVAYTPYLFNSKEDAERIANSEVFQPLYDELAEQSGVRIFAVHGARSPRAIQNKVRPVEKPEDLEGLKIRIPPIDGIRIAFETMGAKPVVLGLGDTYNAIERGQVDGHENGIDAAVGYKWYEVAKYFTPTDHIFETAAFYVNEGLWQSFSEEDREIFRQAAKTGGAAMTKAGEEVDQEGYAIFAENGVEVTQPDKEAFRAALADVYQQSEGSVWPEGLVAKIRAMQD